MSADPSKPADYKSAQYEFTEEHGRTIGGLADAMRAVAVPLQLLGLAFAIFFGLQVAKGMGTDPQHYAPAIGLGAAAVLFLAIGFWTGGAAASFRKVIETKNEDVWHLMNALRRLHGMYGLLRTLIIGALVLAVVGITLAAAGVIAK